jgi:nitrite reductase/ring-hydroxylating ferredoxin subunit
MAGAEPMRDELDAGYEPVCRAEDVRPETMLGVTLSDGTRVCVVNRDGRFSAVSDRCPHQKFPLSDGELTSDGAIVCSWHAAAFDCRTGAPVRGPVRDGGEREPPFGRLKVFDVRVVSGMICVRAPQELF